MSLFQTLLPSRLRSQACDTAACSSTGADLGATVKPAYDIKETADAFNVVVQLPGVAKDGLEFTAEEGQLRIVGRRAWKQPEGWTPLYRETADATYELVLTHDQAINAEKIHAEIRDGVLRVTLPKAEAVKPRKIVVN